MTPKHLIGVAVLALLGAEAWALATPAPGDTISELVWAMRDKGWPIGELLAFIGGHFFWPRKLPAGPVPVAALLDASPFLSSDALRRIRDEIESKSTALIPEGAKGAAILVLDGNGTEIGGAMKRGRHFVIEASLLQRWAKERPTAQIRVRAVW